MSILAFALITLSTAIPAAIEIHTSGSAAGKPAFAEDRVLVKFKPGVSAAHVTDALARAQNVRAILVRKARFFDMTVVGVSAAKTDIPNIVKAIAAWPDVEYAEPDYRVYAAARPNDASFSSLWGLENTGQSGGTPGADINATEAWDTFTGDPTLVVGVIDTGIDYNHPDLAANIWVNPGEIPGNGIDDDGNGYIDDIHGINAITGSGNPMDDESHGTHCAGTIGAVGNNSQGVVGVAWNVKLMALKFLDSGGSGYTSDAVEALEYATRMKTDYDVNIKITSNSWGGGGYSQSLADAISAANAAGILFVAAAGNSSDDTDTNPHYPSSYDLPNVISVASSDPNDALSWFSNYGATSVDLAAPGSDILSTTPGNSYQTFSGTSMATPHVAGAAALLWGYDPTLSLADVKSTLMNTVDPRAVFMGRTVAGGRLNLHTALNCDPGTPLVQPSLMDGFTTYQGREKTLSVAFSACTSLTGAQATAAFSNGDTSLALLDDGLAPDQQANDGVYTAIWTPRTAGFVDVTFTLVDAGTPYSQVVSGEIIEALTYFMDDEAAFDWRDISATGTALSLSDDSVAGPIAFDFNYYGVDYTDLYVSSNGVLYFGTPSNRYINPTIPSDNDGANTFIAPFWDDLVPDSGGVYYQVFGASPNRQLVVQWHNVHLYGGSITGSFQVILDELDRSILFQYLDTDFGDVSRDHGADATIGLQRTADYGQLYSYNQASLTNPQSIRWWLGGNRHRITTRVSPAGAGSVTCTPNPVNEGSDSTCTATANIGYTFSNWAGDCSGTQASCLLQSITADKSVTANFTANIYTVSTATTNGSISPTTRSVVHGATTTFTVTPSTGYSIGTVTGCGGMLSGNTYTTGAITAACTVNAHFTRNTYAVTASGTANGFISPARRSVAHGATTTFTVTPHSGYRIGTVTGCGGTLSGTTYTTGAITAPCTVNASFTLASSTAALIVAKAGNGTGTVSSEPGGIDCGSSCVAHYVLGTSVRLTATASVGARFDGWSGYADCADGQVTLVADRQCTATFTVTTPSGKAYVGLYAPGSGRFHLRNAHSGGPANVTFGYGPGGRGWIPLTGDWNGDGRTTVGLYNPIAGTFYLRNTHSGGAADVSFGFGPAGRSWRPLAGDWNGDGRTTVGLYNPAAGTFYLRNANAAGAANVTFRFGPTGRGWLPLTGDWDGDGRTTVGLYNPAAGTFYLRNANVGGPANVTFDFGPAGRGWLPLTGDWNGNGRTTIGLYNPAGGSFYLRNAHSGGAADVTFAFGPAGVGWTPLTGDWVR